MRSRQGWATESLEFQTEGLHFLVGSEDLWGAKRGRGRMGICEQSSFRKPSWIRYLISRSPLQISDIGSYFFSRCLNTSNRHQTSSSMLWNMGRCIHQLLLCQQNTASSPKPLSCCLPRLGKASCFMSYSLWAHISGLTFPWWRWPELCLCLLEG